MKYTIVYLLLFSLIICACIYFFYNKENSIENFEVTTNNYIESDKFPNLPTPSNYIEIDCYSTIKGIQEEFITFITDYTNFRGHIDRYNPDTKYEYVEYGRRYNDIRVNVDLLPSIPTYGYNTGDIGFTNDRGEAEGFLLYYSGGYVKPGDYRIGRNGMNNIKTNSRISPPERIELVEVPSVSKYDTNFNNFKTYLNENIPYITKQLLKAAPVWCFNKLKVKLDPVNKSLYNFQNNFRKSFWNPTAEVLLTSIAGNALREHLTSPSGCPYNIGEFLGTFPSRNTDIDRGALEKLRVYTYGSVLSNHINDFKESAFYGSLFNFNNINVIDLYLRISYTSSNLNGLDLQYSHALFSNDVSPRSQQYYFYDPNAAAISFNNETFNFLNQANNTLTFPSGSDSRFIEGNPTSVTLNLSNVTLRQKFVGTLTPKLVAKMAPILRRYITSWSYNRTFRILTRRLEDFDSDNTNTKKFYFLMGLAFNNYFYSKNINDNVGMDNWKNLLTRFGLNNPDTSFGPEEVGGHAGHNIIDDSSYNTGGSYGLMYGYFNSNAASLTYSISQDRWWAHSIATKDYNTSGSIYRKINSHGTLPTITDTLINELYTYYTTYIQKLVPDYGTPYNVLDQRVLDSIAQQFYEISEGLHEIIYIYDVYRVGSNMIDIRFDKKQRLDNMSYLNIRNQYIPQLNEYNKLLNEFNDGTWVTTYSNIDTYTAALSTSIANLEPVFNPVYPIGGTYNYLYLDQVQNNNNIVMNRLSNELSIKILGIQSQTQTATGSNVNLSNIIQQPQNINVVRDITTLQNQYNSTINAGYELSNQINGIETNVARVFITINGSNFSINSISLGMNAALSYNKAYNGNIDVELTGQGNVNYQPTIRYTKNVKPPIQCANIEFMKTAANLYRDTIFTDISNIVLSNIPYDSNKGVIVVDKILGFSQINDTTCGYTWIETQYDDYTNKPNRRNTVNVRIPFIYDDSEYQNSRITFCNDPTLMKYSSNAYPFGNLYAWIDLWSSDTRNSLQRDISNYTLKLAQTTIELSNIVGRSNQPYNFSNTVGWEQYKNTRTIFFEGRIINYTPTLTRTINPSDYKIRGVDVNTFILNSLSNKTILQIFNEGMSIMSNRLIYNPIYNGIFGTYYDDDTDWEFNRFYYNIDMDKLNLIFNDTLNLYSDATNTFNATMGGTSIDYPLNIYIWCNILGVINHNKIISDLKSSRREYVNKLEEKNSITSNINNLRSQLTNLDTMAIEMSNSFTLDPQIQNYIINKLIVIPRYLSDSDTKLNDADGACPALRCDNPTVMTQLMEQYNTDSNNPNKILNMLNVFTVNPYQCDYRVTTLMSNKEATIKGLRSNILLIQNSNKVLENNKVPIQSNIQTLNNQIPSIDATITDLNSQANTYYRTPEGIQIINDRNNAWTPLNAKRDSLFQNKIMPSNFGSNISLHTVLGNNTYNWTMYIKTKYKDFTRLDQTYTGAYFPQILFDPLLSNLPEDYPYPNSNHSNKLPLNFTKDSEYDTLYSNYIVKDNIYKSHYFNQIAQKTSEKTNIQNQITTLQNQIAGLQNIIGTNEAEIQNLYNRTNATNTETLSFAVGTDVRDCAYFYATVSNTGYFVSENQKPPATMNNKSNATGFYYINTTFDDFNSNVSNLINPLISEGIKQSSNMYSAVSNQRSDTYDSLGKLNILTFNSNVQSLNSSSVLNMLLTNKRFLTSIFLSYPRNTYIQSIKGFAITNSNTVQLLFNSANIINTGSIISLGPSVTSCGEFDVKVTSNYQDYTAYYIKNISLNISKEFLLNMSNSLPYVNNSPITIPNPIVLSNYVKLVNSSNYADIPQCEPIRWYDSNIFFNSLNVIGYSPNDIDSIRFLKNVAEFTIKTTENIPFYKKTFKLTAVYSPNEITQYNTTSNTNTMNLICSNPKILFSDIDIRSNLQNYIGNISDQNIMNIFRNTFNSMNMISNGTVFSPTIGKFYTADFNYAKPNSLFYSCSLLYKNNSNVYDLTRLPNDIAFDNQKYYQVNFIYSAEKKTYLVETYSETPRFSGYNIIDTNSLPIDYTFYITNFLYKKVRFTPIVPLNSNYDQTSVSLLSIELYKNNIRIEAPIITSFEWMGTIYRNLTNYALLQAGGTISSSALTRLEYLTNGTDPMPIPITMNFNDRASFDGFSFVSGDNPNKSLRRWAFEGSLDGTTFFPIYLQTTDYVYPNTSLYFRTPLFYLNKSLPNLPLAQTVNVNVYKISECPTLNPINSILVNSLYQSIAYRININSIEYSNASKMYIFGYKLSDLTNSVIYFLKLSYINGSQTYNIYLKNTRKLTTITNCSNISFSVDHGNVFSDIIVLPETTNLEPSFSGYTFDLTGFRILNTNTTIASCSINPATPTMTAYISSTLIAQLGTRYGTISNVTIRRYFIDDLISTIYYLFSYMTNSPYTGINTYYDIYSIQYRLVNCELIINTTVSPFLYGSLPNETDVINYITRANGLWTILTTAFVDYDKKLMKTYIKFESKSPLLFNSITLYNRNKNIMSYKVKDKFTHSIILETEDALFGYSFVTNNSGTSPNSWVVKASDGKIWEDIHEQSYNLYSKKLYQTPIFFLDGSVSNANATQPQPQSFEKPEIDIEKFKKYYKQKISESSNPEFKKYMYSNNTYYFIFDDYDLNRNLVSKDLIIGFETSGSRIKKAILYEDNDGNYKPFNLHESKQKEFWDSMIGLALEFQDI